jgi:magnesium-transporting ATPase (P-type)
VTGPFRNNNPFAVLFIVFYGLLLRFGSFVVPVPAIRSESDGWLYPVLFGWAMPADGSPGVVPSLLAALLTIVQALSLNAIANREKLLGRPNHLPGMSHLIVCSLFPEWWGLSSAMVANTLLIPVWGALNAIFNNPRTGRHLFHAGLLIGLAALVHKPALGFVAWVFGALFTMGAGSAANWLVAPFGLFIPFYFLLSGLYLGDRWGEAASIFPQAGFFAPPKTENPSLHYSGLVYMAVMLAYGVWRIQSQVFKMLIRNRKIWNIAAFYLLLAVAIPFFLASGDISSRLLMAPALAVFHASGYGETKPRWIPETIHIVALVIVAWANLRALSA